MVHKPAWFKDGQVFVSFAETVGINKDGNVLFEVDATTGKRSTVIDDKVADDVAALLDNEDAPTGRWVDNSEFPVAVPLYYDNHRAAALQALLEKPELEGTVARSIGSLIDSGDLTARAGHGSPSADMRDGTVPYIKVSDIRAGQVNINPTNLVPVVVAERFWKGKTSSLEPFDLVTPVRASKNIGEFALLMPGQQDVVITKEVLILRTTSAAPADNFYLMWALSLKAVRDQWKRIVFMQTNREDVGRRYLEIEIPWPKNNEISNRLAKSFITYYEGIDSLRTNFIRALEANQNHYVFLGSSATESSDSA